MSAMIKKTIRFLAVPWGEKVNKMSRFWSYLLTRLYYSRIIGVVGRGSIIYSPLLLVNARHIKMGNSVVIRNGARLEMVVTEGAPAPCLDIGNNVNIEQNVHIVCGGSVRIGDNVSLTANVAIVDVNHPYEDIADTSKIADRIECVGNYVEIGEGTCIGLGSIILPNVRIGRRVMIGSHSLVNCDIPDYSVAVGNPARVIKRYDFDLKEWVKVA